MVLPAEPLLTCRRASGAEVRAGGQLEEKPRCQTDFADREVSMEYTWLAWRYYLAGGTDAKSILTLREQYVLTKQASPTANVAEPDAGVPEERSASGPAMPSDE